MICPNCDGILGGGYCQGCGWRSGDPWPAHRLVAGTTHPLKARELYPDDVTGVKPEIVIQMPAPDTATVAEELHTPTQGDAIPVGNVEPYPAFSGTLPEITRANAEDGEQPEPKKVIDKNVQ